MPLEKRSIEKGKILDKRDLQYMCYNYKWGDGHKQCKNCKLYDTCKKYMWPTIQSETFIYRDLYDHIWVLKNGRKFILEANMVLGDENKL